MWCVALVLLVVAGCARGPLPARPGTGLGGPLPADQSVGTSAPSPPRRFTQGEALYIRHCADCHGWAGRGDGPIAQLLEGKPPSLRRPQLFTRYTEAELVARILFGKDLRVPLAPAAVPATEGEVTALVTHLHRLPTIPWEQVAKGEEVYDSLCVSCHGIYGRGDGLMASALPRPPRDLSAPSSQTQLSEAELLRLISEGQGAMPGAADVLSGADLRAVITFVRLFSPGYELYDRFCAVCHGPDGHPPALALQERGGAAHVEEEPPTFDQAYFRTHPDEQVRVWIRHMLKENRAVMPHFAGEISADTVRQILTYLRTLPPES